MRGNRRVLSQRGSSRKGQDRSASSIAIVKVVGGLESEDTGRNPFSSDRYRPYDFEAYSSSLARHGLLTKESAITYEETPLVPYDADETLQNLGYSSHRLCTPSTNPALAISPNGPERTSARSTGIKKREARRQVHKSIRFASF